jgi:ABC-2 type transport system permease protein
MSTATLSPTLGGARLTGGGILRSEWIKLRTVRSTVWSYVVVLAASIGLAALMASTFPVDDLVGAPADQQTGLVVQAATSGALFGQLVVAVLGVLVISGEYSTGMIRSTLAAVPRRLGALWAKAIVLFLATFVVGLVSSFGAFLVAAPIFAANGIQASLLDEGVPAALVGSALYLALVAVLSLGMGAILRNSAGGIAAAVGVILILPIVFMLIPTQWASDLGAYTPSSAGGALYSFGPVPDGSLAPWQGGLVLLAWVAAALIIGAALLKRRDA